MKIKAIILGTMTGLWVGVVSGQELTIQGGGYVGEKLFEVASGRVISGWGVGPGGEVYYLETDSAMVAPTRLMRRGAGDGYVGATAIYSYGAAVYGSFVKWNEGSVYFGENSGGTIREVRVDGSVDLLGVVAGNYDGAFWGGELYLSHNPGGFSPENRVSRYGFLADGSGGRMLGVGDVIVDTEGDYSGPLVFDGEGSLYYGGSGSYGRQGLYRFGAGAVMGAWGAGVLGLGAGNLYLADGGNAYLTRGESGGVWQSDFGTLNVINENGKTGVGTSGDYGIGQLAVEGGALYVAVTNGSYDQSAVYRVVPEASTGVLCLLGLGGILARRRGNR